MKSFRIFFGLAIVAFLLAGCAVQEPPTHFYALSATLDDAPPLSEHVPLKIGIGPLNFPKVLQRPQVVTRTDDNRIDVADFHQWGGRLDDDFLRILADDLVMLLGSTNIYTYPWDGRLRPDLQIRINVSRFDGTRGQEVMLRARWQLIDRKSGKALTSEQSVIVEPVEDDSYAAYVAAQSRALGKFARQLAQAVRRAAQRLR